MNMQHTDREFEEELGRIRDIIASMGRKVETMLAEGISALEARDADLASRVIQADREVDRLEIETDELCLRVLARRQPVGPDLRFVATALKLVTDVERIGDMCVSIAECATALAQESDGEILDDISAMAQAVREMVVQALQAFTAADASLARSVIEADRAVDVRYAQAFRQLLNRMTEDQHNIFWATRMQDVARYLERIGDHATNLAEMVVFMVHGKDIRHAESLAKPAGRESRGILFLCVHNAARSQIAEGCARQCFPQTVEIWSAGSDPALDIDPRAVEVMREVGIDISAQRPKLISTVPLGRVDTVITLCAEEICVTLPGIIRREAWILPDPASEAETGQEAVAVFRRVRDEIRLLVERLSESLASE